MYNVTVREYARLKKTDQPEQQNPSMDFAEITPSAFEYLYELNQELAEQGQQFLSLGKNTSELKVQNFVGVIETPCGTEIEILPKHNDVLGDEAQSRKILIKMLGHVLSLPQKDSGVASIEKFEVPITEWFYSQFLVALQKLYRIGIRFDYQKVEEEMSFLRGQLDTAKQIQKPATKQHKFSIRHDVFTSNRAENRLIRLCIDLICKRAKDPTIWRKAHKFHLLFAEVSPAQDVRQDFKHWKNDRLMSHYTEIKYWCEIVLGQQIPFSVKGNKRGKSILFPMEKLFEKYVEFRLLNQLEKGAKLESQKSSHYLAKYDVGQTTKKIFNLKPDLMIEYLCQQESRKKYLILDTKWKLINAVADENFGLKQSDLYQMFAYNHMYQGHQSDIVLIYPKHAHFVQALQPFLFNIHTSLGDELQPKIWIVPFDLLSDKLEIGDLNISGLVA
ncbi:McrC family protein [Acinetobacter guillouiae]|uniref:McrC family protein n=1 Tax=Acinetobacter guillouiae TaxID=106649 RepID=UPI003AF6CA59